MKKLAVVFPGVGYHKDKPLLYYAKKIAVQNDFETFDIAFTDLPGDIKDSRENLIKSMGQVTAQAEAQLKDKGLEDYDELLFISKSIGTVAASVYAKKHELKVKQIYFTPLEQTFSLIQQGNGLVFHGDKDPFARTEIIKDKCAENCLELKIYQGANHSLETGDAVHDLEILTDTLQRVNDFIAFVVPGMIFLSPSSQRLR